MLRRAINSAPEAYKRNDPGGQGLASNVLLACRSTVLLFATSNLYCEDEDLRELYA